MRLPWYIAALGAALVWGLHYPLIDRALKHISAFSVLFLTAVGVIALAPFYYQRLALDYATLKTLPGGARLQVLAIALTSVAGSLLLFVSIQDKNATLASLIEISYPLFVALFAYAVFGERALTPGVLAGGALIFAGVALIVARNP